MIYDRLLWICDLPAGTLLQSKLKKRSKHFCAELTVYHRRHWEAVQAGTRVDCMVQLPGGQEISSGQYALYGGKVYRIEEAQHTTDEDNLPVCNLSLRREGGNFQVGKPS